MKESTKAKETIKWMNLFKLMVSQADIYAIGQQSLVKVLKGDINKIINDCNKIIENGK